MLFLVPLLALQASPGAVPVPPPLNQQLHHVTHGEEHWVRGKTYKASVSPEGAAYIPLLGPTAPRNFPVRFRLASATLAGEPLELADLGQVQRKGDRYVIDRGPVDVLYDFDLEFVEQSFLLDAAGVDGDLVLDLRVSTELEAGVMGDGLAFRGPLGGVDYGAAVVLDGDGKRADVAAELVGDRLSLTVPASFLRNATGEILVDPLISTYVVDDYPTFLDAVDVAHAGLEGHDIYVYQDAISGPDRDIYVVIQPAGGGLPVWTGYLELSAEDVTVPKVAVASAAGNALVVAQRASSTQGVIVVGWFLDASGGPQGSEFVVAQGALADQVLAPDVGGDSDPFSGNPQYLVTWTRAIPGSGTAAEFRTVNAAGPLGPVVSWGASSTVYSGGTVVSKDRSFSLGNLHWNVAYFQRIAFGAPDQLVVAQVSGSGAVLSGPSSVFDAPAFASYDEIDVSGSIAAGASSASFLVTGVETYPDGSTTRRVVQCRDSQALAIHDLTDLENGPPDRRSHSLRVAKSQASGGVPKFVLTYQESMPGGTPDVLCTILDAPRSAGLAVSERRLFLGQGLNPSAKGPALASHLSGGSPDGLVKVAWPELQSGSAYTQISGATVGVRSDQAVGEQFCRGVINSTDRRGYLAMFGDGDPTALQTLEGTDLPVGVFGYFIAGQGRDPLPGAGGSAGVLCLGGSTIGRYVSDVLQTACSGTVQFDIDPQRIPLGSGFHAATVGEYWRFQFWHRDVMGGNPTSNFTNGVGVLFQ